MEEKDLLQSLVLQSLEKARARLQRVNLGTTEPVPDDVTGGVASPPSRSSAGQVLWHPKKDLVK